MKHWSLLIWLPQFAISIAAPLVLFLVGANYLHTHWGWGTWVIAVGLVLGLITAAVGFRDTVVAMLAASGHRKKEKEPTVFFNSHQ